jgi:hypothetical protein
VIDAARCVGCCGPFAPALGATESSAPAFAEDGICVDVAWAVGIGVAEP